MKNVIDKVLGESYLGQIHGIDLPLNPFVCPESNTVCEWSEYTLQSPAMIRANRCDFLGKRTTFTHSLLLAIINEFFIRYRLMLYSIMLQNIHGAWLLLLRSGSRIVAKDL